MDMEREDSITQQSLAVRRHKTIRNRVRPDRSVVTLLAGAALTCAPLVASAEEEDGSNLSYAVTIEIQNDYNFDSDDPLAEFNDTFATITGEFSYAFGAGSSINATALIEPVEDPIDDRFFEDHGFYFEELFYAQEFRGVEFVLGKYNPAFGFAWDAAPGIYGVDFAEDYQILERLGAAVNIPVLGGDHVFQFALFQADRTILSDSIGTERGQTNILSGGVSNTNGPESFSATLTGEFGDTAYNLGFQHQARGVGDVKDQSGVVGGVIQSFNSVEVLGEVAYLEGFEGTPYDALYVTAGVSVPVGPVSLSGVFSLRDIETMPTDRLFTVAGEIELLDNVTASLGYRFGDEGGVDTQTFGTLIVVEF
ncbi:MAG: hypothetical protein AAGA22_06355 [Pseudomonadota bacterium]